MAGEIRKMYLYEVFRHGNDEEGANGSDTIFLVRAYDHIRAAELADEILETMPHESVDSWCQGVYELGVSHLESLECVLFGPALNTAANFGGNPAWQRFKRDDRWLFDGPCIRCGYGRDPADESVESEACPMCGWGGSENKKDGKPE